jgi:hypothetical protein
MSVRLPTSTEGERQRRILDAADERGGADEAVGRRLGVSSLRRRVAGERLLDAPGMPVPDIHELIGELDELRVRRVRA